MAEQEIIKHTKSVFRIWSDRNSPIWHKLKNFLGEILIIVFAITLSLGFHNWSERRSEQKQVKVFLLGLRSDLEADIVETKEALVEYKEFEQLYTYFSNFSEDRKPNTDSLHDAVQKINSTYTLRPHMTRFNSFLSAGKIMSIEDDSLSLSILNYYQETLPAVKASEGGWIGANSRIRTFLFDNVNDYDNDVDIWKVLATSKGRHLSKTLIPWSQLIERYQQIITDGEVIITKIDKLYPANKE